MFRFDRQLIKNFDWVMLAAVLLIAIMGLINLYSAIKVKVKVNGQWIYMILDSGASDVLLPDHLLEDSAFRSELEFQDENMVYELADGRQITASKAKVKEFTIGDFTLLDLEVAFSDAVAMPLLGKSVLEQFTSWIVYKKNQLILQP